MKENKEKNDEKVKSSTVSIQRRRVTKAGLVAPVFMTLLNRPAWGAGSRSLCTVSGFDSTIVKGGVTSGVVDPDVCVGIHELGYWGNQSNNASGLNIQATPFNSIFTSSSNTDTFETIFNDFNNSNIDNRDLRFSGLYLDALSGLADFPLGGPADVIDIYNGVLTFFPSGWFTVDADNYIDYLLTHL